MTIETERGRNEEDNDKLKRLLEKGFTANYSITNDQESARHTYVFLCKGKKLMMTIPFLLSQPNQ